MAKAPFEPDDASAGKKYTPPKPGSDIRVIKPNAPVKPKPNPKDAGIYTAEMGPPPDEPDMGSVREVKKARGGKIGSASSRADGCCERGKTKGRIV